MSYTITSRDGSVSIPILDGTIDNTTSISLPGPNYVGYGDALNENLIHLLENFAHTVQPPNRLLQGQLWFDKSTQTLKVYTGTSGWQPVSGITNSTLQPGVDTVAVPKVGDFWYKQTTGQLYIYDTYGADGFKLIGPTYTSGQGISGAIPVSLTDGSTNIHNVLKLQYGDTTYATISGSQFNPVGFESGFPTIYAGITFNNSIANPVINASIIGSVTGSVTGDLTGNVNATTLRGTLTGNVVGNVTGNVVATTLVGTLTGNVTSTNGAIVNLTTANAQITGGSITGITNLTTTTALATNFSSGNAVITGGSITGISLSTASSLQTTNFSSGNALITGGSLTGISAISATSATLLGLTSTTAQATNFSSGNAVITGGSLAGIATINASTVQATNFSSGNAVITGGSATGLATLTATTAQVSNLVTSNALVTGGNISNTVGVNNTLTNPSLVNATATTKALTDKSTAVATTAFVHSVIPTGAIIMWGGLASAIPAGWQLCDGSGGTPDLRGQFIVGASATGGYAVGATGGANSVTIDSTMIPSHAHTQTGTFSTTAGGQHNHSASVYDPGHSHTIGYRAAGGWTGPWYEMNYDDSQKSTSTSLTGISVSIADSTTHAHSVTISGSTTSTGGGQPHENRPPFYALCYIQKTS